MRLIYLLGEKLLASQEELHSMELAMSFTVRTLSQKHISELNIADVIILQAILHFGTPLDIYLQQPSYIYVLKYHAICASPSTYIHYTKKRLCDVLLFMHISISTLPTNLPSSSLLLCFTAHFLASQSVSDVYLIAVPIACNVFCPIK